MPSPPESTNGWLDLVLKSLAVFGAIGGCIAAFWTRLASAVLAARAAHSLAGVFGEEAGPEIQRLFAIIARSDGEQQLRQRVVESHLKIGVYECDLSGKCIWCNPYLAELFGLDSERMRGYGWLSAIVPDERIDVQKRWRISVDQGIPYDDTYTIENQRTMKRVRCRSRADLVKADSEPLCYVGWVKVVPIPENKE